jgi:C1A family cysteine protease
MDTEADYPYTSFAGSCWSKPGVVTASTYQNVKKNSAQDLKAAIALQPVSVTIDSASYPFLHYMSGVITSAECGTKLDHAVVAVGYGTENGQDYFIVRNSWGADWGEHGHVRIGINGDGAGICGIQEQSLFPSTD